MSSKLHFKPHFDFKLKGVEGQLDGDINKAIIHITKSSFNYFITLTDLQKKVIICHSTGACVQKKTRKILKSPYSIDALVDKLIPYLRLYKIQFLHLYVKIEIDQHVYNFCHLLSSKGIIIYEIWEMFNPAHNGVKSPKLPRK